MAMRRLIYFSNAAEGVGPRDIEDILTVSRRRNAEAGVTGLLLFMHGVFAQVLEGETQQVDSVYRRIEADDRHVEPEILSDRTVAQRSFTDWSMAYLETTADDLARAAGFDRLFEEPEFLPVLEDHPEKLEDGIALALQRYAERLEREGARASG